MEYKKQEDELVIMPVTEDVDAIVDTVTTNDVKDDVKDNELNKNVTDDNISDISDIDFKKSLIETRDEMQKNQPDDLERLTKTLDPDDITLEYLVEFCTKFFYGQATDDEIIVFGNSLKVRNFLTLKEKEASISRILALRDVEMQDNKAVFTTTIELYRFFDLILSYTNILTFGYEHLMTIENYEYIFPIIWELVYTTIQMDLRVADQMLDRALSYENLLNLIKSFDISSKNLKSYRKQLEEDLEFFESNKKSISEFADILKNS